MRKKEELDLYIEEHVMNHVNYKRKIDSNTNEEYYEGSYPLHHLYKVTIQDDEIEYVFNKLNEKGILVVGDSPVLYGDFENYRYVIKPMYSKPKEQFDKEKNDALIKELKNMKVETSEDKEKYDILRKQIISMNARFVDYIVSAFNCNEFSDEELASYGYEGLIIAVDKFNPEKGLFSVFAKKCIQGQIINGIKQMKGFTSRHFSYKYALAKAELEHELGIEIDDATEYIDEIAKKIHSQDEFPVNTVEELKTRISLMNTLSIDEIGDTFYDDNTLYNEVIESENKKNFMDDFNDLTTLTVKEKEYLIVKYGLIDGINKTGEAAGKILGCSRQCVSDIEKRALKKLQRKWAHIKFGSYYDDIGEYDYCPTGIETVNVKQKVK